MIASQIAPQGLALVPGTGSPTEVGGGGGALALSQQPGFLQPPRALFGWGSPVCPSSQPAEPLPTHLPAAPEPATGKCRLHWEHRAVPALLGASFSSLHPFHHPLTHMKVIISSNIFASVFMSPIPSANSCNCQHGSTNTSAKDKAIISKHSSLSLHCHHLNH